MSKKCCKTKVSYFTEEEAKVLAMPGLDIYLCPFCKNYHSTSKSKKSENSKRFRDYKILNKKRYK